MEDYAIDIMIGKGESAKSIRFNPVSYTHLIISVVLFLIWKLVYLKGQDTDSDACVSVDEPIFITTLL